MRILLWEKRMQKGYSTRRLSEISGISKSAINKIENDEVSPTVETMERLAKALECRFFELFEE